MSEGSHDKACLLTNCLSEMLKVGEMGGEGERGRGRKDCKRNENCMYHGKLTQCTRHSYNCTIVRLSVYFSHLYNFFEVIVRIRSRMNVEFSTVLNHFPVPHFRRCPKRQSVVTRCLFTGTDKEGTGAAGGMEREVYSRLTKAKKLLTFPLYSRSVRPVTCLRQSPSKRHMEPYSR